MRLVYNLLKGRSKRDVETLESVAEVVDVLNGLDDATEIRINFKGFGYYIDNIQYGALPPQEAAELIEREFITAPGIPVTQHRRVFPLIYTEINHEFYKSKKSQRHYIDVFEGGVEHWIEAGVAYLPDSREHRKSPYLRAHLAYTI